MSYDYNALVTSITTHRTAAIAAVARNDDDKFKQHIQEALQVFDTLSSHCPMTPLLWMQYAYDFYQMMASIAIASKSTAVARQTRLETLEVGVEAFPGSAVLNLHYCELLVENLLMTQKEQSTQDKKEMYNDDDIETIQVALLKAIERVGSGSHRTEGEIVAQLYRLYAFFALNIQKSSDAALASWLQRAKTPMGDANSTLVEEVRDFFSNANLPQATLEEFMPALDDARRWEAKAFSSLQSCEEDVTVAQVQDGIAWNSVVDFTPPLVDEDKPFAFVTTNTGFEDTVLKGQEQPQNYWNGLGGAATAKAFLQYTTTCRKFRFPRDDGDDDRNDDDDEKSVFSKQEFQRKQYQLIVSVFERGIAECPTVEGLWLAYLKHMTWLWNNAPKYAPLPQAFRALTLRAVRNCPFSSALVQQQLHVALLLSNGDDSDFVLDPEDLLSIVTAALDSKFILAPIQAYDLFMTAIKVIQRRILSILATSTLGHDPHNKTKGGIPVLLEYDDAQLIPSKAPKANTKDTLGLVAPVLDEETWTEIRDDCEEIRDMFDEALKRLAKDHTSWTEGRCILQEHWGRIEQLVVGPLLAIRSPANTGHAGASNGDVSQTPLGHLEKAIRLHNPPHPDSYRNLIHHVLHHGASQHPNAAADWSPGDVVARLRQVRGLFQKAVQSCGKGKSNDTTSAQEGGTDIMELRDYETALTNLCYEYQEFERLFGSEQSLANATRLIQTKLQKIAARSHQQLSRENALPLKKRKLSAGEDQDPLSKRHKTESEAQQNQNKKTHKVKVGHIFHKAHPFTIRVTNLAAETDEMDLVQAFLHEHNCGTIVHVRIPREKHAKGNNASKGWGLVQFEERDSVEKALQFSSKMELDGQILTIERSHVPAVGIVPPGANHGGKKGKNPKGNKGKPSADDKKDTKHVGDAGIGSEEKVISAKNTSVLAFRPRGVGPKKQRPKAKLDLT